MIQCAFDFYPGGSVTPTALTEGDIDLPSSSNDPHQLDFFDPQVFDIAVDNLATHLREQGAPVG